MFWSNDYMVRPLNSWAIIPLRQIAQVHRGRHHVTTLKMFSNRTKNTECTNTQNVSSAAFHSYHAHTAASP